MGSKREGVMLCYPYSEKRFLTQYSSRGMIQPKLNGDRCRAIVSSSDVYLVSSQANDITCVQHINKALLPLCTLLSGNMTFTFDGELYVHGMPHQTIHSIVAQKRFPHERSEEMEYHVFDIITTGHQWERIRGVHELLNGFADCIKVVPTYIAHTIKEIEYFYEKFVSEGYEGFVIRNPEAYYQEKKTTDMMKCKPRSQSIARIVLMEEERSIEGMPKGQLGAFKCVDEVTGSVFHVGTGLTEAQRRAFWAKGDKKMCGERLVYKFQELSETGIPIFPVFVEVKGGKK